MAAGSMSRATAARVTMIAADAGASGNTALADQLMRMADRFERGELGDPDKPQGRNDFQQADEDEVAADGNDETGDQQEN